MLWCSISKESRDGYLELDKVWGGGSLKHMGVIQLLLLIGRLRYVGVTWFLFHVLQRLVIKFTQQNLCCISKSTMKHMQELDFPLFSYGYHKWMFVDFFTRYIGPPNCIHYWL